MACLIPAGIKNIWMTIVYRPYKRAMFIQKYKILSNCNKLCSIKIIKL